MSISQSNEETERTHYCMYIHTTKSETVQAVFHFLNTPDVYNKTLMQVHYESEQKCLDSFLGVLRINTHGSSKWWSQRKTKKNLRTQDERVSLVNKTRDYQYIIIIKTYCRWTVKPDSHLQNSNSFRVIKANNVLCHNDSPSALRTKSSSLNPRYPCLIGYRNDPQGFKFKHTTETPHLLQSMCADEME